MYALLRLYGELRGKLITDRQQDEAIQDDLKRAQAVLEMLEPGFDVSGIKPRFKNTPNPWFPKGQAFRIALDVLTKADRPLTIPEIAQAMFKAKGASRTPSGRPCGTCLRPCLRRSSGGRENQSGLIEREKGRSGASFDATQRFFRRKKPLVISESPGRQHLDFRTNIPIYLL